MSLDSLFPNEYATKLDDLNWDFPVGAFDGGDFGEASAVGSSGGLALQTSEPHIKDASSIDFFSASSTATPSTPTSCSSTSTPTPTPGTGEDEGTLSTHTPAQNQQGSASFPLSYSTWSRRLLSRRASFQQSDMDALSIRFRSRREGFRPLDSSLYKSLIYELHFTGLPSSIDLNVSVHAVDAESLAPMYLSSSTKKPLASTKPFGDLTVDSSSGTLVRKHKLYFHDISYHHQKKSFRLLITFCDSDANPVAEMVSTPFKVYARRPDASVPNSRKLKKNRAQKRKREQKDENAAPPTKRCRSVGTFKDDLNDLFDCVASLGKEPSHGAALKNKALQMIMSKFGCA